MTKRLLAAVLSVLPMAAPAFAADAPPKVPEITGHRGESFEAPENTMASFNLGWERKVDAEELDVHLTKDGKLIVCHDYDTLRTGGEKLVIKDHTVEELRKLDVGKWKDPKFAGEKLPLLDEVLPTIPEGRRLFIEIKIGPEAVPELMACLKRANKKPEQTVIIAFDIKAVTEAKKQLPNIQAYWLVSQKMNKETKKFAPTLKSMIDKAKAAKLDGLDVSSKGPIDAEYVKQVHDAGLKLYVWTVDEVEEAKKLASLGVDSITTNRPSWLREQLRAGK